MLFNSLSFAVFLPIVFAIYWVIDFRIKLDHYKILGTKFQNSCLILQKILKWQIKIQTIIIP